MLGETNARLTSASSQAEAVGPGVTPDQYRSGLTFWAQTAPWFGCSGRTRVAAEVPDGADEVSVQDLRRII